MHDFCNNSNFKRFFSCDVAAEKSAGNSNGCKNSAPPSRSCLRKHLIMILCQEKE